MQGKNNYLKLKQEVPTTWNSTYDMFRGIIQLKEPVLSTLALFNTGLQPLNETEWLIPNKACELLSIFHVVTVELSSDKSVTISKVN